MSSAFVQLSAAIAALLAAGTPVADKITRDRTSPVVREHESLVNVRLVSTKGQRAAVAGGPMDWSTVFGIETYFRATADQVATDAADAVFQAAYERLVGQGAALAVGVEDVLPDPNITWEVDEGETPLAVVTFNVEILHRTEALTLAPRN